MTQPIRAFKLRPAENRPNTYAEEMPEIDRKRATAVLVRQSKTGADTARLFILFAYAAASYAVMLGVLLLSL